MKEESDAPNVEPNKAHTLQDDKDEIDSRLNIDISDSYIQQNILTDRVKETRSLLENERG